VVWKEGLRKDMASPAQGQAGGYIQTDIGGFHLGHPKFGLDHHQITTLNPKLSGGFGVYLEHGLWVLTAESRYTPKL